MFLCDKCLESHVTVSTNATHTMMKLTEAQNGNASHEAELVCPSHHGNTLRYYCCSCETAVCEDCTRVEHIGHDTMLLAEATQEQTKMLTTLIREARQHIPAIEQSLHLVADVSKKLKTKSKQAENQICNAIESLSRLLSQRKVDLLADLEAMYQRKQDTLLQQKETLENILTRIAQGCDFTEETLLKGKETEILLVKKEFSEKLKELGALDIHYLPEENAFLSFDETHFHNARKSLHTMGTINSNSAVAYESTASGSGLKHCFVGQPAVVIIATKDRKGDLIKVGSTGLCGAVMSISGDTIIEPLISDQKNGTYELTYMVKSEGLYHINIKLYGENIKGSPFKIKATFGGEELDQFGTSSKIPRTIPVKQKGTKRPSSSRSHGSNRKSNPIEDDLLMKVGVKGRNRGEFTNPQGVHTAGGKILVADSNNQTVQVFSVNGEFRMKFGTPGRVAGRMQRPTGVAMTGIGNYLVADYDNKWVSVFSPDGKYINKFGTGKLLGPKGLAVDNNGRIIVVDNKASSVLIFQSNGRFITRFGCRGNDESQFAGPHFVAITSDNGIIISDFHNHCIKVFDSEGNFQFTFGSNGEGNGQFNAPTGVAVDNFGNILVADWGNSRIQVSVCLYYCVTK